MFIAHKRSDGKLQPLKEHLESVAKQAGEFARPFGAEKHAQRVGLLHDIGKYSSDGQKRMNDPEHMRKVDHATAGAQVACNSLKGVPSLEGISSAFAIVGHHGGLPDLGIRADGKDVPTLWGRCKKSLIGGLNYALWKKEISIKSDKVLPAWLNIQSVYQSQFYIRMLFSCLVDADYLDTERFMQDTPPVRGKGDSLEMLYIRLKEHIQPWLDGADTELNERRSEILRRCLQGANDARGMHTLTVPTGGGKTISSLAFALSHAVKHHLKRIIYVIPYTSIIEQNAAVFSGILGEENVLEHHFNVDFQEDINDDEDEAQRRKKAATENWDAPIIVTTAVQFFESLYAAKPSRCRKLHHLADSVIIFDEAQMMPREYLRPCTAAIAELVQHYGVTAVLCTATQPSLDALIHEYAPRMEIREICPRMNEMQEFFKRVHFVWENQLGNEELAQYLSERSQSLCIVNTRKRAQQIFELLPTESRFHLSTRMTPEHRTRILQEVKRRLKENLACHVVSTSLIEAGVDVDFPQVWREEAGLDSILQSAGRCNREGKRSKEESAVHIFRAEGQPLRRIAENVKVMRATVEGREADSYETIRKYFDSLHGLSDKTGMDRKGILELCGSMSFRTIAEKFHLIDEDTVAVYIPTKENGELLNELRLGIVSRGRLRKLGRSAVNVYRTELDGLLGAGKVQEYHGFYVLVDESAYDMECGLIQEESAGNALWI